MGVAVEVGRLQVCGRGLTEQRLVVRVVPDVSGVDRYFDYIVPSGLADRAVPGAVVRVTLNGRRIAGWIVARSDVDDDRETFRDEPSPIQLQSLASVSGSGVSPELLPLTRWTADRWSGPWRSILVAASAPRVRDRPSPADYVGAEHPVDRSHPEALFGASPPPLGRLCLVAPQSQVMTRIVALRSLGPLLILCPSVDMAVRGAAWLRKQGLTVAEYPREWSKAAGGVDAIIGTRSAVWAPAPRLGAVVVVDEHEASHSESRFPAWDARIVAVERARRSGVPCVMFSPVPSLRALAEVASGATSIEVADSSPWAGVGLVDLASDAESKGLKRTLLSSTLLSLCSDRSKRTAVVLNTLDSSVLSSCKGCGVLARCGACSATLRPGVGRNLHCPTCDAEAPGVCDACGSTSFRRRALGVKELANQIERATGVAVRTVSADSDFENEVPATSHITVGTEMLLHRLRDFDSVILADVDPYLFSARLGAMEQLWTLVARAIRVLGDGGVVLLQTREAAHPLLTGLRECATGGASSYLRWADGELARRETLELPPSVPSAVVDLSPDEIRSLIDPETEVRLGPVPDGTLIIAPDRAKLLRVIRTVRQHRTRVKVSVDPLTI